MRLIGACLRPPSLIGYSIKWQSLPVMSWIQVSLKSVWSQWWVEWLRDWSFHQLWIPLPSSPPFFEGSFLFRASRSHLVFIPFLMAHGTFPLLKSVAPSHIPTTHQWLTVAQSTWSYIIPLTSWLMYIIDTSYANAIPHENSIHLFSPLQFIQALHIISDHRWRAGSFWAHI